MDQIARAEEEDEGGPALQKLARPAAPSAPAGSGRWVESSWDLGRGLTVHEGLPADAGLDEWLEAMLLGSDGGTIPLSPERGAS